VFKTEKLEDPKLGGKNSSARGDISSNSRGMDSRNHGVKYRGGEYLAKKKRKEKDLQRFVEGEGIKTGGRKGGQKPIPYSTNVRIGGM